MTAPKAGQMVHVEFDAPVTDTYDNGQWVTVRVDDEWATDVWPTVCTVICPRLAVGDTLVAADDNEPPVGTILRFDTLGGWIGRKHNGWSTSLGNTGQEWAQYGGSAYTVLYVGGS